jgi:hypothetical protein
LRDSPPERLKPFFAALREWKSQIRILQTMQKRIEAEMVDAAFAREEAAPISRFE